MPINISASSAQEIKRFHHKAWQEADREHYGPKDKWISKFFVLKATEKGKIVGTIKAQYDAGVVYIQQVIVASNKRRLGIGEKLLQELVKRTKRLGAHKLFLLTGKNWEACRFYEKLGFKKIISLPKHYLKREFVIYSKFI